MGCRTDPPLSLAWSLLPISKDPTITPLCCGLLSTSLLELSSLLSRESVSPVTRTALVDPQMYALDGGGLQGFSTKPVPPTDHRHKTRSHWHLEVVGFGVRNQPHPPASLLPLPQSPQEPQDRVNSWLGTSALANPQFLSAGWALLNPAACRPRLQVRVCFLLRAAGLAHGERDGERCRDEDSSHRHPTVGQWLGPPSGDLTAPLAPPLPYTQGYRLQGYPISWEADGRGLRASPLQQQ